jgi:hypothetical protein
MRRVDADEHDVVCAERDALKAEVARLTAPVEPPKNKHADKIADKSWRDYDMEPVAFIEPPELIDGGYKVPDKFAALLDDKDELIRQVNAQEWPGKAASYDSEPDGLEEV